MSEHEDQLLDEPVTSYDPGGRRRKGRGLKGCLAVLVALVVLVGGFYVALTQGVSWVSDQFQGPDDYAGPGTGSIEFTVNEGDTVAQIGRNLKEEDVTKSVQAFIDAAAGESASSGIQVGDYELQKQMKAADALEVLIDPANLIGFPTVTIPEGLRLTEIVSTLSENTDFRKGAWNKALGSGRIGLPDYAEGNAEGYLFPATYEIKPGMKPVAILKMMVARWAEAAEAADLEAKAAELGHTPAELMIIASLIEAEGRGEDMPKIARVIYNRLDGPGDKGGTNGTLGIDAAIAYGLGLSPGRPSSRPSSWPRTRPTTPGSTPACRRRRSRRRATTRSPPRPTPRRATGTTTSRSTSPPVRPSSSRTTTGSSRVATSTRPTARPRTVVDAAVKGQRCGVLGDPISHSLSPVLHRAAYSALGLDWSYDAHRVPAGGLESFVAGLDASWRGLSLTMPLKREALALADRVTDRARLAGAVNTLLLEGDERVGDNTDLPGAVAAIRERTSLPLASAAILGGGATAASIGLALVDLGVTTIEVLVRDEARAGETIDLLRAHPAGVDVRAGAWTRPVGSPSTSSSRPSPRPRRPSRWSRAAPECRSSSRRSTTRGRPRSRHRSTRLAVARWWAASTCSCTRPWSRSSCSPDFLRRST